MPNSDSIAKIAPALVAAQKELGKATKKANNPHFKSKYADVTEVLETATAALHKHGIAVLQRNVLLLNGEPALQTKLLHESGEWIADDGQPLRPTKQDPQGYGGAQTYARRYGLAAMIGLGQEDDDGNDASSGPARKHTARPASAAKPSWAAS